MILSGGSINSPQLLQLSGVGNAAELGALGIDVVHDLPGVGEHLQDHLEVYIQYKSTQPVSMQPSLQTWRRPLIGAELAVSAGAARGQPTTSRVAASSGATTTCAYPNLMFHFLPLSIRYDGTGPKGGHGYQVHIGPMYSDSRGSVKITSTDPAVHPALRFNYLSTEQDRREWVEAIRVARSILNQAAFGRYNGGETSPGSSVQTDAQILEWVARDAETALHPSCTARMGIDDQSVVDPLTMAVHGLDGLQRRRRLGYALRHERQHLRAGHDAGREGRRPDPGQHAPRSRADPLLPPRRGYAPDDPGRGRGQLVGLGSSQARTRAPLSLSQRGCVR